MNVFSHGYRAWTVERIETKGQIIERPPFEKCRNFSNLQATDDCGKKSAMAVVSTVVLDEVYRGTSVSLSLGKEAAAGSVIAMSAQANEMPPSA